MLRKLLCILCALVLCMGSAALAEGDVISVDIDGLYAFEHPSQLEVQSLAEEDYEDGLCYSAYDAELGVDVYKYDSEGETLDTLYDDYLNNGEFLSVEQLELGGMSAVGYELDEYQFAVTLLAENGYLYDFIFFYDGEGARALADAMVASICAQ